MPEPQAIGEFIWQLMPEGPEKYQAYLCSREWAVLRRAVLDRCGGVCERCHVNPVSAVHHLTYERKYAEQIEDLVGWCQGCHEFTHGKRDGDPLLVHQRSLAEQRPLEIRPGQTEVEYDPGKSTVVCCPFCNSENCHMLREPQWSEGDQGHLVVRMYCESCHEWDMVFDGSHGTLRAWVENGKET